MTMCVTQAHVSDNLMATLIIIGNNAETCSRVCAVQNNSLASYNYFLKLWEFFKIPNYHLLFYIYSALDSAVLMDVLIFYYGYLYKICNLWPSYYISAASFSLNSFLLNGRDPKNANKPIKLHLLNSEISQIYAKSLLGGYSVSSSNYAFFTGLDVKDSLKNMEQRQIIYADANRLVATF